jgi:hypothetical protein
MEISIPVVFMLINSRTCVKVLSLLYYAQDSVIQIDINNKSIPHVLVFWPHYVFGQNHLNVKML